MSNIDERLQLLEEENERLNTLLRDGLPVYEVQIYGPDTYGWVRENSGIDFKDAKRVGLLINISKREIIE